MLPVSEMLPGDVGVYIVIYVVATLSGSSVNTHAALILLSHVLADIVPLFKLKGLEVHMKTAMLVLTYGVNCSFMAPFG
jgi:hypothetical protein